MAVIITNSSNIQTSGALNISANTSASLNLNSNSIVFLTSSNRVGIAGNINPGYALDTIGDNNVTGNYRVNGNILSDNNRNVFAANLSASAISVLGSVTAQSFTGSFSGSIGIAVWASSSNNSVSASYLSGSNAIVTSLTASGIYDTGNAYIAGNITIGGNVTTLGSSSIVNITSSAVDIGTNLILINAYSPFQRYAGISAMDSGSATPVSSSILWDSLNNRWIFQGDAGSYGAILSSSVLIGGPVSQIGNETTLSVNTIPKATTGINIGDSLLTDNGTILNYSGVGFTSSYEKVTNNLTVGGSIIANSILSNTSISASTLNVASITGSFTGSLYGNTIGTASWATVASSVSGVLTNGNLPSQINVTGVTASFTGSLTGILIGTASCANSSSISTTSNNTLYNLTFVSGSSGYQPLFDNTGLQFNPSTGTAIVSIVSASTVSASYANIVNLTASNALINNNIVIGGFANVGTNIILGTQIINPGSATGQTNSNFIGYYAGYFATNAANSNFIGWQSGYQGVNSNDSNFMGYASGQNANNAPSSNFFGRFAGATDANGSVAQNSNFFGYYAGQNAPSASYSNFIGASAGSGATNAQNSNFIGQNAGNGSYGASYSTFIGFQAGRSAYKVNNSIFIGNNAGNNDTANNTGNHSSILIGDYTFTSGSSDSICIGRGTANTQANQVNIGNLIFGNGIWGAGQLGSTGSAVIGGKVGIGTNNPINAFDVIGNISCSIITASLLFGTSSYAITSSYVNGTIINGNLPSQINVTGITSSFTGSLIGTLTGTASWANSASYSVTSSYSLGSANAFLQGGNSFGAAAVLGTNDENILTVKTNNISRLVFDTGSTAGITASAIITPSSDGTYTLGTAGARFKDFFSVQNTIGALLETGLTTKGISSYQNGTILIWENGKLIKSYEEFDNRVAGVVQLGKDEPVVFGAEPVLVTGKVDEGDYIVTSNKIGHGMGISRNTNPIELFGNVIAQAVESGCGDSYTIKAMIRKM